MTGKKPYWYGASGDRLMQEITLQGQWEEKGIWAQSELEVLLGKELGVGQDKMDPVETDEEYNNSGYFNWHRPFKAGLPGNDWSWHTITLYSQPETGEVVSIFTDYPGEKIETQVFSHEEALSQAISFLEKVLPKGETSMRVSRMPELSENIPDWADESLIKDGEESIIPFYSFGPNNCSFFFSPLYHGIPIYGQDYRVTVNLITGKVTSYSKGSLEFTTGLPDGVSRPDSRFRPRDFRARARSLPCREGAWRLRAALFDRLWAVDLPLPAWRDGVHSRLAPAWRVCAHGLAP
jgi:hypothetical protein